MEIVLFIPMALGPAAVRWQAARGTPFALRWRSRQGEHFRGSGCEGRIAPMQQQSKQSGSLHP